MLLFKKKQVRSPLADQHRLGGFKQHIDAASCSKAPSSWLLPEVLGRVHFLLSQLLEVLCSVARPRPELLASPSLTASSPVLCLTRGPHLPPRGSFVMTLGLLGTGSLELGDTTEPHLFHICEQLRTGGHNRTLLVSCT